MMRPRLPGFDDALSMRGLRVGEARADLRFIRRRGRIALEVEALEGDLEVTMEDDDERPR